MQELLPKTLEEHRQYLYDISRLMLFYVHLHLTNLHPGEESFQQVIRNRVDIYRKTDANPGPHTPALGFGLGLERLQLLMETQHLPFPEPERCNLYIASMGDRALQSAAQIVSALRQEGVCAEFDVVGRSVKAQMKYANKIGAKFTMVLGDSELDSGKAILKNMETGEQREMELAAFEGDFMRLSISESLKEIEALGVDTDIDLDAILNTNLF